MFITSLLIYLPWLNVLCVSNKGLFTGKNLGVFFLSFGCDILSNAFFLVGRFFEELLYFVLVDMPEDKEFSESKNNMSKNIHEML